MARKADPNKKTQIIDAATLVFARKGYDRALMTQVAEAAGIGKGTIYEYFSSKEDLFFGIFEQIMLDAGTQAAEMVDETDGPAAHRLEKMASALIETWMSKLEMYALMMEFWSAAATLSCRQRFKAAFQAGYAEFRELVGALIQKGVDSGEFAPDIEPPKIAAALIGSWDALLLQAWLDPLFDPLSASKEHMRVAIKGMAP